MRDSVDQRTVREFRRRLARRQIGFLLTIVPLTLAFILLPQATWSPFLMPAFILLGGLAILDRLTWRCPSCGVALSSRSVPKSCGGCGALFRHP